MSKEAQFMHVQRQSPIGVLILFFKNLRAAINFVLAVIVVQFGANFKMLGLGLWEWGILLTVVFMVISYLQYRRFFFYIKDEHFIVEKGLLRRDKTSVSFARIQSVNTTQNLVHQLTGVTALKIDTAGSQGKEIEIPALSRAYAGELQDYLMAQKQQHSEEEAKQEEGQAAELGQVPQFAWDQQKPMVHLSLKDLWKVGLSENHLRSGLLLFAIVNGYLWQYEDYLLKPFEPLIEQAANTILASWLVLLPIGILAFLLVSILYSLIRVILQFYDLRFYLNDRGIFMKAGLLKKNDYHLPRQKIQYFKWKSNPLRKRIGYRTLSIKQAGSVADQSRKSISIPGIQVRDLLQVYATFYPDRKVGPSGKLGSHYLLVLQLFTWLILIPALGLTIFFWWKEMPWWSYLPLPVFLILGYLWVFHYYRSIEFRINQEIIEIKKGYVFPSMVSLAHFKLQNIQYRQSYFQRRRGLATLNFYTASGSESMPHLPEHLAKQLYNYLLYKIEDSQRSWM